MEVYASHLSGFFPGNFEPILKHISWRARAQKSSELPQHANPQSSLVTSLHGLGGESLWAALDLFAGKLQWVCALS